MKDAHVRAADVVRVIDGDTFLADVDLGFYVRVRMSCRLAGLNCNELTQPGGMEAREEATRLLNLGAVTVESVSADKFAGRFDAIVHVAPSSQMSFNVNDSLVREGFAVAWNGAGPKPIVPWPRPA